MGLQKTPNGATGTPKLFVKPHTEYETATIKRNSHSLCGYICAELDQDNVFGCDPHTAGI
jgi:non-ribosomal peptide synthetase component E (peptide arylation enzyme)